MHNVFLQITIDMSVKALAVNCYLSKTVLKLKLHVTFHCSPLLGFVKFNFQSKGQIRKQSVV